MSKLKSKKPEEITPGHFKGMIFGRPGVGKTWLALNFPSPVYIDTEDGSSLGHYMAKLKASGGVYLGREDGSCDFDTVLEEIKNLATEKHPYKTLVIDSITKIYQVAIAKEADRLGSKDAFGASKKPAIGYMRKLLNWIDKLNMNVIFVAQEASEWGMVNGQRQEIGKMPDIYDKLIYELNLVLHIQHLNPGYRVATVTKSRLLGFPEYDKFVIQDGKQDLGYAEFSKRYGKDYIEAEVKPIVLCRPEQLAEIDRLLGALKIEESEIEKILTKGNAETIKELTDEQADKFIKWMIAKVTPELEKKDAKN